MSGLLIVDEVLIIPYVNVSTYTHNFNCSEGFQVFCYLSFNYENITELPHKKFKNFIIPKVNEIRGKNVMKFKLFYNNFLSLRIYSTTFTICTRYPLIQNSLHLKRMNKRSFM